MKTQLALSLCIIGSQYCLVQTQQSLAYTNFLNKISSFVTSVQDVLSGPTKLKTLRDAPGCGKRNTRGDRQSNLAECLWDCEWKEPASAYKSLYRKFVRTPVRWDNQTNDIDYKATYDDPKKLFPKAYVDYIELVYGKELDTSDFFVDQYMSLPLLPKDTRCLKDCFFPANIKDTSTRVCVEASYEYFSSDEFNSISHKFNGDFPLLIFYECMIALNVETIDQEFEAKEIRRSGKSFSRDYHMLTSEICFLAERDFYLYYASDQQFNFNNFTLSESNFAQRYGCDEIYFLLLEAILGKSKEELLEATGAQSPGAKSTKNNTSSVIPNYRNYVELAKEDIILRTNQKKGHNRLTGASVFPTDLDLAENSQHHPWACSLRTRGYRGRHRCGVTLLSGPLEDEPKTHDDPYVLVGAAHCNFICKDRIRGDVQETCCCRPPDAEGSCAPNAKFPNVASPFCTGQPVFVLAEPEDVVIICGEFNSGVEILNESWEPEQVFTVTKIIQHPDYKPTKADIEGGPIEGNDIAVYHVIHKDSFKLGQNVTVRVNNNVADEPIETSSQNYIWPACLPKDDRDEVFASDKNHPWNQINKVNAMLAGWLDAPPISQAFSNLLGSSLSEADVLKLYYYPRVMGLEELKQCKDPKYQEDLNKDSSSTFYPKGTLCFKDPSASSCPEFGSSGSGVVRQWAKRIDKKVYSIDGSDTSGSDFINNFNSPDKWKDTYQYSFVGPLSMHKGCDKAFHMYTKSISSVRDSKSNDGIGFKTNKLSYRGENPLVFTDARCFMPWIASQYNMKLEKEYEERENCVKETGKRSNVNQPQCYANFLSLTKQCDFTLCENSNEDVKKCKKWDKCRVLSKEGIAFNVNQCLVKVTKEEKDELGLPSAEAHYRATCFNNCKGVSPNAITAAGVALFALSGISSTAGLGPGAIGVGGAVLAGREVMNLMNRCGEGCCRMNNRCCRLVRRRGMMVCPRRARGCRACTS